MVLSGQNVEHTLESLGVEEALLIWLGNSTLGRAGSGASEFVES